MFTLKLRYKRYKCHHFEGKSNNKNVSSLLAVQSNADISDGTKVKCTPLGKP